MSPFRWQWIVVIGLLTAALLTLMQPQVSAQSTSGLEARISRLEFDITQLRSQINQLSSRPAQPNLPPNRNPPSRSTTPARPGETALAEDPTFKRLATLVIELRDRIITLENQVATLRR